MALQGWRPVEFQPTNQLLNFAPLNQGFATLQQTLNQEREDKRANEQLGMQRERLGMEKQRFDREETDASKQALGNLGMLAAQNPEKYGQQWTAAVSRLVEAGKKKDPNFTLPQEYFDVRVGPHVAISEAKMMPQYLEFQNRQAAERRANEQLALARNQDARAQALHGPQVATAQLQYDAAKRDFETPKIGTADLGPGHSRVFYDPRTGQPISRIEGTPQNKPDDKFGEAAATAQVRRYDETITQGANQAASLGTIQSLRGLSDKIGAPGVSNTIARTLGPSLRNVGIEVGNLSDMEAFNAIISRLVPAQRPPGSGTMSDKDVELFKASLPQLAATAQGRKLILDQIEAIAQYDKQRAEIASKAINGEIPRQQAEILLRQMPDPMELFRQQTGQRQAPQGGRGPQVGTVEQGYRFKGGDPANPQSWEKVQ